MVIDKDILFKQGWVTFELKDYWIEKWNELHSTFNKEIASNELIYFRMDGEFDNDINEVKKEFPNVIAQALDVYPDETTVHIHSLWKGEYTELKSVKERLEPKLISSFQYWYYTDLFKCSGIVEQIYKRIASELYEVSEHTNDKFHIDLSMYDRGCYIENHQDGQEDLKNRFCAILMYLNEDYSEGKGGEMIIENNMTIQPTFGKVVILDFLHNNVKHSVSKVIDENFNRFATISFIYK